MAEDVKLRDCGDYSVGVSPFSDPGSQDPIFLNKELNRFSCSACGRRGDVIEYVMLLYGLSFMSALKHLSEISGIELEYVGKQKRSLPPPHPELNLRNAREVAA